MKKLIIAALVAFAIAVPALVYADGCNSYACTSTGSYTEWHWFPPGWYGCAWSYTLWYDGSYEYTDCHGNESHLYL